MPDFKALKKTELPAFVQKGRVITSIVVLIVLTILFLPWEQTTNGTGTLIAYEPTEREYDVLAPISGFVKKYYVEENKFVKKGDPLFDMIDLDEEYLVKIESVISDIKAQYKNVEDTLNLSNERKKNLEANLRTGLDIHDKKIIQSQESLKILQGKKISQENNYETATSNYERIKSLYLEGIESKRSYELAKNEYIKEGVALDNVIIDIEIKSNNLDISKKEKERFLKEEQNSIKLLENSILADKNKLKYFEQEIKKTSIDFSRNSTSKVLASKDGYPLRILKNDNNLYIKKGEPIVQFAPKPTKTSLLLSIKHLDIPLIKKGLPVRVQFYGWPSFHVSGWPKIKFGTFGGVVDKVDSIAQKDGTFYAYIVEDPSEEPWPDTEILKVGTQATGWVRLSTVFIWYEIWRKRSAQPPIMVNTDKNN